MRYWLATVLVLFVFLPNTRAASRTWTSSGGNFTIEAELVDSQDGKVKLRKADGSVIEVPLAKLSEADRRYVEQQEAKPEAKPDAKPDDESDTEPDALPSESGEPARTWTSKAGAHTIEAALVSVKSGKVKLRKADGQVIEVALVKLSLEDSRYVRRYLAELKREERRKEKEPSSGRTSPGRPGVDLGDGPQTVELKLSMLDPPRRRSGARANPVSQYLMGLTRPQSFYQRSGARTSSTAAAFARIVQKEPKYQSPEPFRGVARLGSGEYGFVLDAVDAKTPGYGRLFFDLDHDGDLAEEKPVLAVDGSGVASSSYWRYQFPRMELKVDVDGTEVEYAFLMSVYTHKSRDSTYSSASLYSGAFREGYVGRGRSRACLVLLDSNANGRFDDKCSVGDAGSGRYTSPRFGDLILVDPDPRAGSGSGVAGNDQFYLSRLVSIDGRFYEVEVSPAGDKLTLSPSKVPIGYVTNPGAAYSAVIYSGEHGVLKINGGQAKRVPLPVGQWKLASYRLVGSNRSAVSARASGNYEAVQVTEDETVPMPFGEPFRPVVTCSGRVSGGKTYLSLSVVGVGGERCTSLTVGGRRPPGPQFVILDPDDKVVEQGKFEYG